MLNNIIRSFIITVLILRLEIIVYILDLYSFWLQISYYIQIL